MTSKTMILFYNIDNDYGKGDFMESKEQISYRMKLVKSIKEITIEETR